MTQANGAAALAVVPPQQTTASYQDQMAAELERDGICVLRGIFSKELIDSWAAAFKETFAQRIKQKGGVALREKARWYMTLPWIKPFADEAVFNDPTINGILHRVFAQGYCMVQLASDTPVEGSVHQDVHRDFNPLFGDRFNTPLYALAVNFPLCDVDEENGPFQMARGTHRMSKAEGLARVASGEIPLESFPMEKGDVMIRTPLALHRGTPNQTPVPRPMVVMGYVMHWLNTPNVHLSVPREFYQTLEPEVQHMLRCDVVDEIQMRPETYLHFKY